MTFSRAALVASSVALPLLTGLTFAAPMSAAAQTAMLGGAPQGCATHDIKLAQSTSQAIELGDSIGNFSVTQPAIADIQPQTARRISVMGVSAGRTDATLTDAFGRCLLRLNIQVSQNLDGLDQVIRAVAPSARVEIHQIGGGGILLLGEVASASQRSKVLRVAQSYVGKPEQVMDGLSQTESDQVMMHVRVVEMNRSVIKQLGFNTQAIFGQLGMDQYVLGNTPSYGVNGSFLGGASAGYQLNTTSQPVATSPVATLFQGLGTSSGLLQAAQAVGIVPSQISQFVTSYLQGTGGLTAGQQSFARQYLTGLLGSVTAEVTEYQLDGTSRLITLTASSEGITSANLPSLTQQYLNDASSLTWRQQAVLNAINRQMPNYANAIAAPESTYIDRSNPANSVATGRAGETGLNQARALIETLERLGTARTLVETTLTSVSGEGASYLAGGRYPVPSGRDNQGNVMTEFQPYGVGLGFTPMVLDGGRISLKASIEVSELTNQGALTLAGVGGTGTSTVIPALAVTKVDNTMELPSGGSMMIAGMLRETTRQNLDKVPNIADIPVFGALARSRDFLKNETELVIIVTPYLVKPVAPGQLQTPADGMRIASDSSANLLGRVNQPYKASPDDPPTAIASRRYEGPIGHVID